VRARVESSFNAQFGSAPAFLVRAPGRVNLIGEHTDYNDGFVLPMAIDREVCIALRGRCDTRVVVHSLDFNETAEFDACAVTHAGNHWSEYLKGVAWALQDADHALRGWEGVISGDVPRGAGLSSSAAVELAALRAFAAASNLSWQPTDAALLGQRVENQWIGVNSGIMDQLIVAHGRADHALLIDCRTLSSEPVPLPAAVEVVILDTNTRRGLVDSAYNERRTQCETAARAFGVPALRDVDVAMFAAGCARLDATTLRRARHVITENQRTVEAAAAMRASDVVRLGQLMNESHASLRDDFEVTNHALNAIVASAQQHSACFGARMTGAGFGGCAVALVATAGCDAFIAEVARHYQTITNLVPRAYRCRAAAGVSLETSFESVNS
jgi:galactokinase